MERTIADFEDFAENLLTGYIPAQIPFRDLSYSEEVIDTAVYNLHSALTENSKLFIGKEDIKRKIILDKCVRLHDYFENENKRYKTDLNHQPLFGEWYKI